MMDFTPGEMLFYGGIAGAAITAVIFVITVIALSVGWRRMNKKQVERYGKNID